MIIAFSKSKNNLIALLAGLFCVLACQEKEDLVIFHTPYGDMTAVLYEDTPKHKENFLKLAKEGHYDSVAFHRVIQDFMIQTGDLSTGTSDMKIDYRIDAEFMPEQYIHEKGALAAARTGGSGNPERQSSGSQFYIVQGKTYDEEGLQTRAQRRDYLNLYDLFDRMLKSKRYPELTEKYNFHVEQSQEDSTYNFQEALEALVYQSKPKIEEVFGDQTDPGYPDWAVERYASLGGAPHLDGAYTVFGQVIDGLAVIDKIAAVPTDARDKPLEVVRMTVEVLSIPKNEVTERYGFTYKK